MLTQPPRAGLLELAADLRTGPDRVHGRDDAPIDAAANQVEDELDAVRRAQGEHIARAHAAGCQPGAYGLPHGGGQLCVAEPTPGGRIDQCLLAPAPGCLSQHELRQRQVGNAGRLQRMAGRQVTLDDGSTHLSSLSDRIRPARLQDRLT